MKDEKIDKLKMKYDSYSFGSILNSFVKLDAVLFDCIYAHLMHSMYVLPVLSHRWLLIDGLEKDQREGERNNKKREERE